MVAFQQDRDTSQNTSGDCMDGQFDKGTLQRRLHCLKALVSKYHSGVVILVDRVKQRRTVVTHYHHADEQQAATAARTHLTYFPHLRHVGTSPLEGTTELLLLW